MQQRPFSVGPPAGPDSCTYEYTVSVLHSRGTAPGSFLNEAAADDRYVLKAPAGLNPEVATADLEAQPTEAQLRAGPAELGARVGVVLVVVVVVAVPAPLAAV